MTDGPQRETVNPSFMNGHLLDYEEKEVRDLNPIPDVYSGRPFTGEDRKPIVPGKIKEYLQNRYGPNIQVNFGSRYGNSDASGYSYSVLNDGQPIAEMESVRTTINMLPPNYEGPLTKVMDEHREKQLLSGGVRQDGPSRVMWRIKETAKAENMRVDQFRRLTQSTQEVSWDPDKTKVKPQS